MICVVHSYEVLPGEKREKLVEGGKKLFKYEKETFGQDVFFMISKTGKWHRIIVGGVFESMGAHEEYLKKVWADARYNELMKEIMQGQTLADFAVPGSFNTDYYEVIE